LNITIGSGFPLTLRIVNGEIMRKCLSIGILFFYIQAKSQILSSSAMDSVVERARISFQVPGIALAVIKDGKIIHAKGYGVRSLRTGLPVDENTLFGIASNTKAFTAFALGMLVDEGKISWNDKVHTWIPEFKMYSPYVTEEFTIRDLLTHRSGLGLGAGDLMLFPDSSDFELKDIIYNLQFLKPVSGFRTKFDYDNNLYIVAGEVVKRVSGMTWEDFVETRILRPVGMSRSASSFDRLKDTSDVIDGHAEVEGEIRVIARRHSSVDHSAGGIYSNIHDLSKWVTLLLNQGYFEPDSSRIFSLAAQAEIWSPQTIIRNSDPGPYHTHFKTYGLGFFLEDVNGYKEVSHTGGLEGMVTQIVMFPELRLGIIVLTNQQETGAFLAISNQIKDGYLGVPYMDWVSDLVTKNNGFKLLNKKITDSIRAEIQKTEEHPPRINFKIYAGKYHDPWLGEVNISEKNGKYWFAARRSPKLSGELIPYKENSFVVIWKTRSMDADAFVIFRLNEKGIANEMKMKAISPLTDFSYDFQDLDFKKMP
jgi:CubicO group peptidase (beta-lactamase class C family)